MYRCCRVGWLGLSLAWAVNGVACGGRTISGEAVGAFGCDSGEQRACTCAGRVPSVQECSPNGTYADCRCGNGNPMQGAGGSGGSSSTGMMSMGGVGGTFMGGVGGTFSAGGMSGSAGSASTGEAGSAGSMSMAGNGGQGGDGLPYAYGDLAPCNTNSSSVFLDGDPGDYIHVGRELLTGIPLTVAQASSELVGLYADSIGAEQAPWSFYFSSEQFSAPLSPIQYLNAERWPFQSASTPGLSVYGAYRGCNTLTGKFAIAQIEWNGDTLLRFKAAFEQHCEGGSAALRGCVYYESGLRFPEPAVDAGAAEPPGAGDAGTADGG